MKIPTDTALEEAEFRAMERVPPKDEEVRAPFGQLRVFTSFTTKLIPAMKPEAAPFL
jgi:hypothetical protein